jgi:putative redox protein
MKVQSVWRGKMRFSAESGDHSVEMDAKSPIGSDSAMTPKELLLSAICGCTGMDVVALLKKYRQPFGSFRVTADAGTAAGRHPEIFTEVHLSFQITGEIDPVKAMEAVRLSQTKYCSVSAMVSKAVPITFTVALNGETIGTGKAQFD